MYFPRQKSLAILLPPNGSSAEMKVVIGIGFLENNPQDFVPPPANERKRCKCTLLLPPACVQRFRQRPRPFSYVNAFLVARLACSLTLSPLHCPGVSPPVERLFRCNLPPVTTLRSDEPPSLCICCSYQITAVERLEQLPSLPLLCSTLALDSIRFLLLH